MRPINIYVTYKEWVDEVVEDTREENVPFSGFTHTRHGYCLEKAYLINPKSVTPYWEGFTVYFDKVPLLVYVLYVRYSTGDTFSYSEGMGSIVGVYNNLEQAERDKCKIEEDKWPGYAAWEGFFEKLESVHIETLTTYG